MLSRLKSLRVGAAGVLLSMIAAIVIVSVPQLSLAVTTPSGPFYPPPGGATVAFSPAEGTPPNDGFIGKTGGSTAAYSAMPGSFTHLWFGPDQTSNPACLSPAFSFDGTITNGTGGECLGSTLITINGNTAIWGMGSSTIKVIDAGTFKTRAINTRFRMVANRTSDNAAINWVSASSAGISSSVGAVIPVPLSGGSPQGFKVMRIFETCVPTGLTNPATPATTPATASCNVGDSNWEPVNTYYNRINTDPSVSTRSSISTGFYWNQAPSALGQSLTTNEDTQLPITLTANDPDGTTPSFSLTTSPANGTLSGSAPNLTYTPNANFNGSDSLSFKVNDGFVDSNVATINITINAINDAPVATGQSVSLDEDGTLDITLAGTDVENDPLTFEVVTPPANGSLNTDNLPTVTYAPNLNFNGPDSFTFRANDGSLWSDDVATVSIIVNAINDAPVAFDDTVETNEDTPLDFELLANDVDGDALAYTITDGPSHGSASVNGSTVHFVPEENYNGDDSITFTASDGTLVSDSAVVTIHIPAVNDAPVAIDQPDVVTDEDNSIPIVLQGTDVDNVPMDLSYEVIEGPSNGSLLINGQMVVYTPNENWNGTDSFKFTVTDPDGAVSNIAEVTITVNPVNDAPVADPQSVSTAEDNALAITLTGSDVENDALTYSIVSDPLHGTVSGEGTDYLYVPVADYCGPDAFTFQADDSAATGVATVSIDVECVNDPPVAQDQSLSTDEDTALPVTLVALDVEGDALTYSVLGGPSHGTLDGSGASLVYSPFANYNGPDSFSFVANDGTDDGTVGTVSIVVNAVNDNPDAAPDLAATEQYTPVTIDVLANDGDLDGDTVTVVSATSTSKGATTVNANGTITYRPNTSFKDSDVFHYVISDGKGGNATGEVTVTEITCGEDGVDHLQGTPAEGAASQPIDRQVEPLVGGIDPDTAANVHAYNCSYVVPAENAADDLIP
ncbi:MAG: Ig-like domain-containing protein [Actinomycetota bacterium]|nr:tandem-95 repeat protein [Actinomycetota bacterium]